METGRRSATRKVMPDQYATKLRSFCPRNAGVIKIETRVAGDTVSLTGNVQAQTEINQSFRIDGRLIERNVEVGDTVKPGQLLARLDPLNEETALQSARAQLAAAQAQNVEARTNQGRLRDLLRKTPCRAPPSIRPMHC